MVGNTPIKPEIAAQIVAFRKAGWTHIKILRLSQSVVFQIFARYQSTGLTILLNCSLNPHQSLIKYRAKLVQEQYDDTCCRILNWNLTMLLGNHDCQEYRRSSSLCKEVQKLDSEEWRKVLFSDEICVQQFNYGKVLVHRQKSERYNHRFATVTLKHSPSPIIWGVHICSGTWRYWRGKYWLTL